ncbi:MAG: SNF2-related protein [Tepidisphaerales bacterium]
MSVLDRFAKPVSESRRQSALLSIDSHAVEIRGAGRNYVEAIVHCDGGDQRARLDFTAGQVHPSCDCGSFAANGLCDHVVAAALVAEAQGRIPNSSSHETLPRRRDRQAMWLSATGELRRAGDDDTRPVVRHQPAQPNWKRQLAKLKDTGAAPAEPPAEPWPADRQLLYVVDLPASIESRTLVIRLACRDLRANGDWSRPRTRGISFPLPADLPPGEDQRIVALLRGLSQRGGAQYDPAFEIASTMRHLVLRSICATHRAVLRTDLESDELAPLRWDEQPYELWLEGRREESTQQYVLTGVLRREDERVPLSRTLALLAGGIVFFADRAAAVDDPGAHRWAPLLRQGRSIAVPVAQGDDLLKELFELPSLPRLDLPPELALETIRQSPRPKLKVRTSRPDELRPERLRAELLFDYGGVTLHQADDPSRPVFVAGKKTLIVRDPAAEKGATEMLKRIGLRDATGTTADTEFWFNQRHLTRVVHALLEAGWLVEAHGRLLRRPGRLRLNVSSGIDWFELRGEVDFGDGRHASLKDLVAAMRRGENSITLDDGTVGMLPQQWLSRNSVLATMAKQDGDTLKFSHSQIGLLDALLAAQPDVRVDETFDRMRQQIRRFEGICPQDPSDSFVGELRPYQKDGLGWFEFLRRFHFGGCLADDMGLGKTVQVLALLEQRRRERLDKGASINPSLVVVPKSLVFNWRQEATRFTPGLSILDHTGIDRIRSGNHLSDYDLVLTTYGTLRRDAAFLKDVEFDYVVLDEAQSVKNPASESAKAVRLVKGKHRLALSGTPVQNHMGDLWSLFDFLNPGMLGAASVFGNGGSLRTPDEESRSILSRALRPFILRRTKEQVASDLPQKLEQTLYCELDAEQRKLYNDLRDFYRQSILSAVDRDGLSKSKMQILEALLRLRQAALHPGLIDPARLPESSAKLDMLLPRLEEIIEEGHKALVFSQFTSMLAIVRTALDREGVAYEYLDGKTRDREQRVEHFQNDAKCSLFLISLKAGGLGLNLTAADYVYLLDPWWNPAVETQAIDRAHRIGQTRQVFACRLIAKDTVEEKVLALQNTKRQLADAIITADNSVIRGLERDDLELLLS